MTVRAEQRPLKGRKQQEHRAEGTVRLLDARPPGEHDSRGLDHRHCCGSSAAVAAAGHLPAWWTARL